MKWNEWMNKRQAAADRKAINETSKWIKCLYKLWSFCFAFELPLNKKWKEQTKMSAICVVMPIDVNGMVFFCVSFGFFARFYLLFYFFYYFRLPFDELQLQNKIESAFGRADFVRWLNKFQFISNCDEWWQQQLFSISSAHARAAHLRR